MKKVIKKTPKGLFLPSGLNSEQLKELKKTQKYIDFINSEKTILEI